MCYTTDLAEILRNKIIYLTLGLMTKTCEMLDFPLTIEFEFLFYGVEIARDITSGSVY